MLACHRKLRLLACNSNPALAKEISDKLGIPCVKATIDRFSDGEIRVQIQESIRGADVFVIQSMSQPVHDNMMELLLVIDALKRASVRSATAVVPYTHMQDRIVNLNHVNPSPQNCWQTCLRLLARTGS